MLNRIARLAAALSIFLAAFGSAPTQAAAQAFTARAAAVSAASSAGGSAAAISAALPASLGAPALGTLSLSAPSARVLPTAAPAAAAAPLAAAPALSAAPVAAALAPAAVPVPAAAAPAAARVLTEGAARLGEASKSEGVSAKSAELDALFTGAAARSSELDAAPALSASRGTALAASSGPRWVFRPETPAPAKPAPRTTIKRTLAIGYLTGFAGMAFTALSTAIIGLLGWAPHGNYQMPFENMHGGLGVALSILGGAAVLAPMAEEVIFRGALQGGLSKLTSKLKLGAFVLPAVATSLVFVAVHETADPVLFAVRFVFAYMLSRVFHKEGILASMTAHGTFNGLATVGMALAMLHAPAILSALILPASVYLAFRSWSVIKSERPEIAAGTLAPKPFTTAHALAIIPALIAGFLFVMPNVYWLAGIALLILWLAGRFAKSAFGALRG